MQKDADFLQGNYRYVAVTINPRGIILLSDSHTNRLARNLILDLVGSPLSNFVHKMLGMVQVSAGLITVQSKHVRFTYQYSSCNKVGCQAHCLMGPTANRMTVGQSSIYVVNLRQAFVYVTSHGG